ncbi:hypothetical protein AOQ71_10260 [Bradyrhizobium manausense]|uniref:Uncharacterized protein n=2 Tax=Bradyrhizobium manausense TaxID=989370 RepID=A0A0R3E4L6_9BRAD|nr:hypothetical protein AOQ71_10260 [Bradyrhizobium manausense]
MHFWTASRGGNCAECSWIAAEGTIVAETPKQAEEFFKTHPEYPNVYLNSPGGNLSAGVQLGRLFRKYSLRVAVGHTTAPTDPDLSSTADIDEGQCVSACSYAFLGGVVREADNNQIGIHQFSWELNNFAQQPSADIQDAAGASAGFSLSTAQVIAGFLITYVQEMGVDPKFVSVASSTEDVHYLSKEELVNLNVRWDSKAFGPWGIRPWGNGIYAFAESHDKKQTAFVFCNSDKHPKMRIQGVEHVSEIKEELKDVDNYMPIEAALGADVTSIKLSQESNGASALDMSLADFDPRGLQGKSDYDLSVRAKTHSVEWLFNFSLSAVGAAAAISAAMRNCN